VNLHPWKQDFIASARQAPGNVLVVAPTGSGKTVVAVHLMRGRTLFVAHRRELIAQAEKRCRQWGVDTSKVTIVSKQALDRRKLPAADVVIFDEAHHVPSKGWARIHQHYREQGAKIYGLTATPVRLDGKGLAGYFDTIVQAPPTSELAAAGHIVVPRVFVPKGRIDLREVRVKDRDFDAKSLDAAVRKVVGSIVGHWRERAEGRQTVVYSVSVAHAEAIAAEFVHAGVTAEVIHGKLRVDARDAMLARFDAGKTKVLVNCEILTEGWDCPAAKCVVLARPTLSFALLMQMIGRITRPNGEAPVVLDLADNCRYFDRQGYNPVGDLTYSLESDYPIGAGCSTLRRCSTCGELVSGGCGCAGSSRPIPEVVEGDLEVWYPSRGLSDAQIDECVKRYEAGESALSIAKSMGVSAPTVLKALRSRGVPIRPSSRSVDAALTSAR
jgi:DNA repair protein RadD